MKRVLVGGVFLLSSLAASSSCFAGGYIATNLGLVAVADSSYKEPGMPAGFTAEVSADTGLGFSLAAGSRFNDIFRGEAEFSYRKNDLDSGTLTYPGGTQTFSMFGDISSLSLMGNIFADINTHSAVAPFVGVGVGISNVDGEIKGINGISVNAGGDDTVFAYQLILGTGFNVDDSTTIDVSYRYFATADPDLNGTEIEYGTHNFMVGVRINF